MLLWVHVTLIGFDFVLFPSQFRAIIFCILQSSQVHLLPKSEILDGVAVYCDANGVTFLGDPPEKFENLKFLRRVFLYSERKCDPSKVTI